MPCGGCSQPSGILSAANRGKSGSYEKELARLEERAIEQLSEKARSVGANAILGIRWGDRRSLLMLVATGTACRVRV